MADTPKVPNPLIHVEGSKGNGFRQAAHGYRLRIKAMKSWNETISRASKYGKNYYSQIRQSFVDVFAPNGGITITQQRLEYYKSKRGYYGMLNNEVPAKHKDAINLQEIIDPAGANQYGDGSIGLLDSMEMQWYKHEEMLGLSISSRATMKPYHRDLPRKSKVYYLTHGWTAPPPDKRKMVPRDWTGYYMRNVDMNRRITPVFSKFAFHGMLFILGASTSKPYEFGIGTNIFTIFRKKD